MQILDALTGAQGRPALENLARSFDISPEAAKSAVDVLVPALTRSMERNTLSAGGLADLVGMLGHTDRQRYLDPDAPLASSAAREDGNAILEQILGSKDASRKAAERAARSTGLDETLLKQLLPAIAGMVMGGLSKQTAPAIGDLVKQLGLEGSPLPLPGEAPRPRSAPIPGTDTESYRPRPAPSGGSATPRSRAPLPIPGDDLPGLGRGGSPGGGGGSFDDLRDILQRNGRGPSGGRPIQIPQQPGGGGTLWSIIRSILGGALGFESKGFLGWLVRLIVFRWGWGIVKRIFTRMLTGR